MQLSVPVREASVVEMMVGSIKYCTVIKLMAMEQLVEYGGMIIVRKVFPVPRLYKSKGPTDQEHAIGAIPKSGLQLH